jgi:hypothetical protein
MCVNRYPCWKKLFDENTKSNMGNRLCRSTPPTNEIEFKHVDDELTPEEEAINVIVERYIHNEKINNRFIPDVVERRIYRNTLKLIIGIMKDTVENASVDVLGHRVTFTMTPLHAQQQENDEKVVNEPIESNENAHFRYQ